MLTTADRLSQFVEEQAIDRVHRLTQTVDVIVYKLTVKGTVEERILELQEKKRLLAMHAIEGGMKKNKDSLKLSLQDLLNLFKPRGDGGAGDDDGPWELVRAEDDARRGGRRRVRRGLGERVRRDGRVRRVVEHGARGGRERHVVRDRRVVQLRVRQQRVHV